MQLIDRAKIDLYERRENITGADNLSDSLYHKILRENMR